MSWVRFLAPFDWTPPEARQSTVAYAPGWVGAVPRACATAAVKAGRAERIRRPANRAAANAVRLAGAGGDKG